MPRYFTHYWTNTTWFDHAERFKGQLLQHTAGNQFIERKVGPGDFIYVVTVFEGILFLGARMQVDRVVSTKDAEEHFATSDLWNASEHIIAKPGSESRLAFDRQVPAAVVKSIKCLSGGLARRLKQDASGGLDKQTLRGVRELTQDSAELLDTLIQESH